MSKTNDFESLMEEAVTNVRADRTQTTQLLNDLLTYISSQSDRHKEVGITLAKYVETLQRSNEQLVKLAALVKKNTDNETELNDADRDKIFDSLHNTINTPKKASKK